MPPLVSIITPSYNQAAFLEQTIQSVLLQDYPEIEYIVVDGASSDGSVDIISKYSKGGGETSNFAHTITSWLSEPDEGQADAINKGFQRATGEIVAWLNSDDLYLPYAVGRAVQGFLSNPGASLVYGDAISIDAPGRPINMLTFRQWDLIDLMSFRIICQPAVFFRRSALDTLPTSESGIYLNPEFHYMLDHLLWLQIGLHPLTQRIPMIYLPQTLAAARQHALAKNIRQAAGFSQEIQAIVQWIQGQPELAPLFRTNTRKVLGGAYRLQARYSLDANQPGLALKYYAQAMSMSPGYALKHWRRILYALTASITAPFRAGSKLPVADPQKRRKRQKAWQAAADLKGWPGIILDESPAGGGS